MRNSKGQFVKGVSYSPKTQFKKGFAGLTNKGNKHSDETKKMIGEKGKRRIPWNFIQDRTKVIGRHNRNFHDSSYKGWRKAVKDRDGWKCKISDCNCNGKLVAHHILPWSKFPELRYEVNNGITLCHFHHPRKRNDEMSLSPFFQSLVKDNESVGL